MISKAVVVGAYQRKLEELACLPDDGADGYCAAGLAR